MACRQNLEMIVSKLAKEKPANGLGNLILVSFQVEILCSTSSRLTLTVTVLSRKLLWGYSVVQFKVEMKLELLWTGNLFSY